jgi:hypothetical protein
LEKIRTADAAENLAPDVDRRTASERVSLAEVARLFGVGFRDLAAAQRGRAEMLGRQRPMLFNELANL